jgi:hypothetical protein
MLLKGIANQINNRIMRKIIGISALLIVGIFFTAFSQTKKPDLEKELELKELNKDTLKTGPDRFYYGDSIKIFIPDLESILNFPDLDGQYFSFRPENGAIVNSDLPYIYRMPIQKPVGNYPMPIYVPDSTINYTLRIKDFK